MKKTKVKNKKPNLFKRWYQLCEPNKTVWFFQILTYMIYAAIFASMTIIAAKTINCLYEGDFNGAFFWLAIEMLNIIVRKLVMHIEYKCYLIGYAGIRKNITVKIFDKIFKSDEKSIKQFSPEKIINIAQDNMSNACEFPDYIANIMQYLVQVIMAIVTIFVANVYAGLVVAALGVLNFFVYNAVHKRMGRYKNGQCEKKDNSFKEYSKILASKNVIYELGSKEYYKDKLLSHIDEYNHQYAKYYGANTFRDNIYGIVWNLVIYAITAVLIYLVSQGSGVFELSMYLIVVPYLKSCTEKLNNLYTKLGNFEDVRVDVDRLELILSLDEKEMIAYGNVNSSAEGYNLGFIGVSCDNDGAKLTDINIAFEMNGVNIVKGPRGCGKRAIFNMLRRYTQPTSGRIVLDNISLFDYSEKTFKQHIDYCSSHPAFINASVKENLIAANKDFHFIQSLVKEFGLEQMINSLPQGYNTPISDITDNETRFWIGLIRAGLSKCKVLMIYEYPDDVSPEFHLRLHNIIAKSEPDKRTIILFTHKDEYDNLASAIYKIEKQKVTKVKQPKTRN